MRLQCDREVQIGWGLLVLVPTVLLELLWPHEVDLVIQHAVVRQAHRTRKPEVEVRLLAVVQEQSLQWDSDGSKESVLLLQHSVSFTHRLVGLLIEERGDNHCLGGGKLLLCEEVVVLRVEREVEDLIPARHCSLIGVCGLDDAVLLVVLDLHLDVGLHLRSVVKLLFRLELPVRPVVLELVLVIVVRVALPLGTICSGSVRSSASTRSLCSTLILLVKVLVLPDYIVSDRYILGLDHVNDDATVLNHVKISGRSLLNGRPELTASGEESLCEGLQNRGVIHELLLFDHTAIDRATLTTFSLLLLLALLDLIVD